MTQSGTPEAVARGPRIVMLGHHPIERDNRVRKEAESLNGLGYEVVVVCPRATVWPPGGRAGEVRVRWIEPADRFAGWFRAYRTILNERSRALGAVHDVGRWRRALRGVRRSALRRRGQIAKWTYARARTVWEPIGYHTDFHAASAAALAELRPDAVHAHDLQTLYAALRHARSHGVPFVYDSHELELAHNRRWTAWRRLVFRLFELRGIRAAGAVITVSPPIAEELSRTYRLPRSALVLNSPSIETSHAAPVCDLRERAGLSEDERLVLYVGGLTVARGLERVLDAMDLLPPTVHLGALAPAKPDREQALRAEAERRGLATRFHLFPAVAAAEVPPVLATADVSVIPFERAGRSYEYAMPNKLFESVMAGVPLAVSGRQTLSTFVREHELGAVFDERDPRSVAAALTAVLDEVPEGIRDRARLAALQRSVAWEEQVEVLAAVYRRLVGSPPRDCVAATAPLADAPAT